MTTETAKPTVGTGLSEGAARPATNACCGSPSTSGSQVASPCCGTAAEARASGGCCGPAAKTEAVAAGAGCCG
jgi:hypothetical protein